MYSQEVLASNGLVHVEAARVLAGGWATTEA
jgi:hypothetical protein